MDLIRARAGAAALVPTIGAVLAAFLTGCGGGGSGGGPVVPPEIRSPEYFYNQSLDDIDAAAAFERGFTGSDARIHALGLHVLADDGQLATAVTRQFEVSPNSVTEIAKIEGRAGCSPTATPNCISPLAQVDTILVQLMAEPRDGWYGQGVAYEAEVWAYRLTEDAARANAIERASAGAAVEVLHLDVGPAAVLSTAEVAALQTSAERKIVTMAAPRSGTIAAEDWQQFAAVAGNSVVVGSIDGSGNLTSAAAGAARDAFLVLPSSADQPYRPAVLAVECNFFFCFLTKSQSFVYGPAYTQAVASGAAALLHGAYPYLSASQITALMLATARDIGAPGVDDVYGHGVLDLERATRPVGALALATGQSVDGGAAPVAATRLALGAAFGDALGDNPLLARGVAFDGFGRPFTVGLDQRVGRAGSSRHDLERVLTADPLQRLTTELAPGVTLGFAGDSAPATVTAASRLHHRQTQRHGEGPSMQLDVAFAGEGRLRLGAGLAPQALLGLGEGTLALAGDDAGFLAGSPGTLPQLGLVGAGLGIATRQPLAAGHDLVLALAADGADIGAPAGERRLLQALSRHRLGTGLTLGFGLGLLEEDGTFLASEAGGAFVDGVRSRTVLGSVLSRYALSGWGFDRWALEGGYTLALARPDLGRHGLLRALDTVTADAWSLGLVGRDVVRPGDRLGLRLAQPLRVAAARGTLDVPVGRDLAGNVVREQSRVELEPSGRELDLELAYALPLGAGSWLTGNVFLRHEPGHAGAAAADLGALARLRLPFAAAR